MAGDTFSPTKTTLRTALRSLRASIGAADRRAAARRAAVRLRSWPPFRRARRIGVYLSVRSELSTAPLIQALHRSGRLPWVPVVTASGMQFAPLRPGARLRKDPLGLPRPVHARPLRQVRAFDLVLLPLIGFDDRGRRLGGGGGYYDRALADRHGRRPLLVGYAYAVQETAAVPAEAWDVTLDAVVTERELRHFRK